MNYLVELHAQVCIVSEGLLERTLKAVLGELADEAVKCFGQIKQFGTGGLLTVRGFFHFLFGNH
jgi:exocyst complex component 2